VPGTDRGLKARMAVLSLVSAAQANVVQGNLVADHVHQAPRIPEDGRGVVRDTGEAEPIPVARALTPIFSS